MLRFLFRLLVAAAVAAVVFSLMAVVTTVPFGGVPEPPWDFVPGLISLVPTVWVFVRVFRRIAPGPGRMGRWRAQRRIEDLKETAVERGVGPRVARVAAVLGGGTYATGTLRVTWNGTVASADAAEGGAWRSVFSARFHPEVAGQIVPDEIRHRREDRSEIVTRRVGHQPAWWEVQGYIPGPWEDELERLDEAARQASHERERERFGIQ